MSRIGKSTVVIPSGVEVNIEGKVATVRRGSRNSGLYSAYNSGSDAGMSWDYGDYGGGGNSSNGNGNNNFLNQKTMDLHNNS